METFGDLLTSISGAYQSYNQADAANKLSSAQKKDAAAKNKLTETLTKFAPWLIGGGVLILALFMFRKK